MKILKQIVAAILCICIVFTMDGSVTLAADMGEENVYLEEKTTEVAITQETTESKIVEEATTEEATTEEVTTEEVTTEEATTEEATTEKATTEETTTEEVATEETTTEEVITETAITKDKSIDSAVSEVTNVPTQVDATKSAGNIVVVIDPGHGGSDTGNVVESFTEKALNLQIALACKAELESYSGVTVYLTRQDDSDLTEEQRVAFAQQKNADLVISIHNNIGGGSGAMLYYSGDNNIAPQMAAQLKLLGMNAVENSTVDDSFINECSNSGITAVVLEQAYMDNSSDVSNYLDASEKLEKVGIADAAGIAACYGLVKTATIATWNNIKSKNSETLTLTWKPLQDVEGYEIWRSTSVNGTYIKIATVKGKDVVTYEDAKLIAGTTYYYKIRGYVGTTKYTYSEIMYAYPVQSPTITQVKSTASGTLKISWNEIANASGYQIYRKDLVTGQYVKIADITSGSRTYYQDKKLKTGIKYSYKIKTKVSLNETTGYSSRSSSASGWSIAKTKINSVVSQANGSLAIKWKKINNVYRYQIFRSTSENGTYTKIATVKSNKVEYNDTTVKAGKKYYYKIRTVNQKNKMNGYGSYSTVVYGIQINRPVISYVKSVSSTSLKIKWGKITGASGYKIYCSTSENGKYSKVATVKGASTTTYKNTKLKTGKTYYYKIQAINKVNGNIGYSTFSQIVSGKTIAKTAITGVQSKNSTKLSITWKKISGASGYILYRSTSETGTYKEIATISSGKTISYVDKHLTEGKKYYYKVKVVRSVHKIDGYSSYSKIVSGKTAKTTKVTMAKAVANSSIQVRWKQVDGASGYQIYRCDTKNGKYVRVGTVSSKKTVSYVDAVPIANKTYYYKVRSYNLNDSTKGYSDWSNIIKGRAIATPTMNAVTLNPNGSLQISWNKVGGAVSYSVYRGRADTLNTVGFTKLVDIDSGDTTSFSDTDVKAGITYYYIVKAFNNYNNVIGSSDFSNYQTYYIFYCEIMGTTSVSAAQMAACFYASGHSYPAGVLAPRGASCIEEFANIVCEEAAAEGVKAEVLWAQIILETGWLQYTNSMVSQDSCNFGGLGATDNSGGACVAVFPDVRTGLRAQAQHLKAYASTAGLNNPCVDTRFGLVTRGTAIYVEWLGQQENPQGYGWATGLGYGDKIRALINQTKSY